MRRAAHALAPRRWRAGADRSTTGGGTTAWTAGASPPMDALLRDAPVQKEHPARFGSSSPARCAAWVRSSPRRVRPTSFRANADSGASWSPRTRYREERSLWLERSPGRPRAEVRAWRPATGHSDGTRRFWVLRPPRLQSQGLCRRDACAGAGRRGIPGRVKSRRTLSLRAHPCYSGRTKAMDYFANRAHENWCGAPARVWMGRRYLATARQHAPCCSRCSRFSSPATRLFVPGESFPMEYRSDVVVPPRHRSPG